jgi:DNA sulfur modification protein DndC
MQEKNPWGFDNSALLTMYQGASPDGECPLVVDATTPSCGDSRFGCWVCTLVEKDKSMSAMIQNDAEKDWMLPLLEFRNELDFRLNGTSADEESSDRHLRDFRRMNGTVQIYNGRPIPGPYTQDARHCWLRKLLGAQTWIRRNGPQEVKTIQLVTLDELQEIRRIWVVEKHELEDTLPNIYLEVTGEAYPGRPLDDNTLLGAEELELLKDVCGDDRIQYELTRELLSTERQQLMAARRSSISEKLEKAITRHYYADPKEAADLAQDKLRRKTKAQTTSVERSP